MTLTLNMEKELKHRMDVVPLSRENFGISVVVVMAIVRQAKLSVVSLSGKTNWFSISRKDHAIPLPSPNHVSFCVLVMDTKNVTRKLSNFNL